MNFNFEQNLILENNHVRLRPLQREDIKNLLPIALEDKTLLDLSPSQIHNETLLTKYIETAVTGRENKSRFPFIIFDKKNERYVGSTSFGNISNKNQRLEIGWTWISRALHGTGFNMYCKLLLLTYAFEKLEAERVELKTDSRNIASRKAILKIGAQYEGALRSHTVMSDGYRRDTVYFGILKNEWKGIKVERFRKYLG